MVVPVNNGIELTEYNAAQSMISDDDRCHTEIRRRIAMGKEAFSRRKELLRED